MKRKYTAVFAVFACLFLFLLAATEFFQNGWGIITDKNYFIPDESNIFVFKVSKMNDGSGDWWLYGEDAKYYYALNQESGSPKYFRFSKGREPENFDKFNYAAWKQ
jgi:hypothetical protein